jgi:hypothetical protein
MKLSIYKLVRARVLIAMNSTGEETKRRCEGTNCRRDAATKCPVFRCGVCCDSLSPCCPENHNRRKKPRGTNKTSEAKRQRRTVQAMIQAAITDMMMMSQWFRDRLQANGFTIRKVTLMIYDHFVLASNGDSSGSSLSFVTPPAELERIEEVLQPMLDDVNESDLTELVAISAHEQSAQIESAMQLEQHTDRKMEPAILESIEMSLEHIDSAMQRQEMIAWRKELYWRLQAPPSEKLLEHGRTVGLNDEALTRLVNKDCPLAFETASQYHSFMDDLATAVKDNLWKTQDELLKTVAKHLNNIQLVISGTSTTLYSEAPGEKKGRLFDEIGKGQSNLDVAIVFETSASLSFSESRELVKAIFFDKPSRSADFDTIQYATRQVETRFDLHPEFLRKWEELLARDVNVTTAFTARTHGYGVLSFNKNYPFAWKPRSLSQKVKAQSASSRSSHAKPQNGRATKTLQEMIAPAPKNRRPTRTSNGASTPHEIHSHYQRDFPRNYSSNSTTDLSELDRGIDTQEITFTKMREWLRARNVFNIFTDVNKKPYEWARDPRHPGLHKKGVWFKCLLREDAVLPELSLNEKGIRLGVDGELIMTPECRKVWKPFVRGIHASSMYSVKRTLQTGLRAGIAKKWNIKGIYCFSMDKHELARKSMGYAMYSELFEDNIFWAPYYELQVLRDAGGCTGIGKITAGDQWVCKEEIVPEFGPMFHLTAVWFHALSLEDLGKKGCNWVSLDRFHKAYELD